MGFCSFIKDGERHTVDLSVLVATPSALATDCLKWE